MLFTSFDFLAFFAVLVGLLVVVRPPRARSWIVLAFSYLFYAAWDWRFLSLLLACSLWNWGLALLIERAEGRARLRWTVLAVTLNLAALGYFKYANFFVQSFADLLGVHVGALAIILPLGISFFTFQGVAYVLDVHRRQHAAEKSLRAFLFFKAFFPQLIAGPIVRADDFMNQVERPFRFSRPMIIMGVQYFLAGAVSKLVFADNLAICVDQVFNKPGLFDAPTLWLGVMAYTGQIFTDFFGYSMMAIGLARILGYRLPLNFRMPYTSLSIQEFWRRWHITLSNWLRDYLYISLGGNRKGRARTYANLILTMLVGGLWHGASWNFVFWGGLHGLALAFNRVWSRPWLGGTRLGRVVAWAVTFLFVSLAWIPFRAGNFTTAWTILKGLIGLGEGQASWPYAPALVLLALLTAWHLAFAFSPGWLKGRLGFRKPLGWLASAVIVAEIAAIVLYAPVGQAPFIYFQF
jgi:alginate O-acetyltransferase complex protein AlgI